MRSMLSWTPVMKRRQDSSAARSANSSHKQQSYQAGTCRRSAPPPRLPGCTLMKLSLLNADGESPIKQTPPGRQQSGIRSLFFPQDGEGLCWVFLFFFFAPPGVENNWGASYGPNWLPTV